MGGVGRERIHNMKHDFKFISKHSPQVKSAYSNLMEILSLVHDDLRKQYTFQHEPVGSYSRNMITYDAKSNKGFYMLPERFQWIKDNGLKGALYTLYIRRKNNNDDPNKHSRSLFVEAVNACYNENCDE